MANQKCPKCRFKLKKKKLKSGSYGMVCETCGWEQKVTGGSTAPRKGFLQDWAAVPPAYGTQLFAGWVLMLLLIFMPYVIMYFLGDQLVEPQTLEYFLYLYFPIILIYLGLCLFSRPQLLSDKMNWVIDDYSTYEDDYNRGNFAGAVFMVPGVLVIYVLYSTIRIFVPQ